MNEQKDYDGIDRFVSLWLTITIILQDHPDMKKGMNE